VTAAVRRREETTKEIVEAVSRAVVTGSGYSHDGGHRQSVRLRTPHQLKEQLWLN
jgi:hypothetical protein